MAQVDLIGRDIFRPIHSEEKNRIIHGIWGVCGEIYEHLGFDKIIQGSIKTVNTMSC